MMEHIIYKTTNILNNRFYIGMHSTENVNDGYLGSGRRIKAEIKKYGKENFVREILEYLPTREVLLAREAELVCEELMQDPLCLNLKNGGEGGGKIWNDAHARKFQLAGSLAFSTKINTDESFRQKFSNRATKTWTGRKHLPESIIKMVKSKAEKNVWVGKKHSAETKLKMSKPKNRGESNSQFGTCWINDGDKAIKVKKDELEKYLLGGYSKGRTLRV